jgi:toxin-antitoxin system PIN domain toxin
MTFLLDANVLIALGDPKHVHHLRVQQWFHAQKSLSWATCPLTENAFLRIVGGSGYPIDYGQPADVRVVLRRMCSWPGHQFWADEISLLDVAIFPKLTVSKKLTDLYLLALAIRKQGQLATLDQRINPAILPGGTDSYLLVP